MPTAKARYRGSGAGTSPRQFTKRLRDELRAFYPNKMAVLDPVFGHPADQFVNVILSEAGWAADALHWQSFESTRQELRAEQRNLLKSLKTAHKKLLALSPDFDRLLGVVCVPQSFATDLEPLIREVEAASQSIDRVPRAAKPRDKRREVAVELAIRVLRVLNEYGIRASATDSEGGARSASAAVQILSAIGGDIGLVLAPSTWRHRVMDAKRAAPGIK